MSRGGIWRGVHFLMKGISAGPPTSMNSRSSAETAGGGQATPTASPSASLDPTQQAVAGHPSFVDGDPMVFSKTLRLFLFPPASATPPAVRALVSGEPASSPRVTPLVDDSSFSPAILEWMRQGDRLADARPPEPVEPLDASDLAEDPLPPPLLTPISLQLKRPQARDRRPRRWLTVGAAIAAVWAAVLWASRQSATIVDRPAFAAITAAKRAEPTPPPPAPPSATPQSAAASSWVTPAAAAAPASATRPHPSQHPVAGKHPRRARR
jgi:hypothetical protein